MNRRFLYFIAETGTLLLSMVVISLCCKERQRAVPSLSLAEIGTTLAKDSLVIIFSGDFMQHTPQIERARKAEGGFDYSKVFENIAKLWEMGDYVVVNLETTLSDSPPYSGYPMFCSPSELLDGLKSAGVTTLALANNHCVDRGAQGVEKSIEAIKGRGFGYVGISDSTTTNNIAWLRGSRLKVALLNYTYGTNGMPIPASCSVNLIDTTAIRRDYNQAISQGASRVVIYYHWGNEYQLHPDKIQRELAIWSRELGAEYVIGSHPHVAQPIDRENNIVYSLGNLCSNQHFPYTQGGINAIITLYTDGTSKLDHFAHWVDRDNNYKIMVDSDTTTFHNTQFLKSIDDSHKIACSKISY